MDKMYSFRVKVTLPDKSKRLEVYKVSEAETKLGASIAAGKCVRYFETLKEKKQIRDFNIMF